MKDKEKLINLINRKVIHGSPEIQRFVKQQLSIEGRLSENIFNKFISNSISINYFDTNVLVWIAEALENFNSEICKVSDFFEDGEILNAKMYIYPTEDIDKYLVFHNAIKLTPNSEQYLCTASVKQLGILKTNDILKVSTEAQRDSHTIKYGDEEINVIKINDKRTEELGQKIDEERYFFNDIRINVVKDNNSLSKINYNAKNKTITLDKDSLNIIPDGNHRSVACERLLTWHPEKINYYDNFLFPVLITNESMFGCKAIVDQEWNREPVSRQQIASMKRSDSNQVIEFIMNSDMADPIFKKRIVRTKKEIQIGNGFILMPVLSNAIENYYDINSIKTISGKQSLKDWLIDFCNELTDIMKEDFINFNSVKTSKWNVLPSTWYFYIALSAKLQNKNNWRKDLRNIIKEINWSIDSNPYKGVFSPKKLIEVTKNLFENITLSDK